MTADRNDKPRPAGRCPACGKPRDQRFRPFCSRLCRDRDLMKWFEGAYTVPAVEIDDDEDDLDPPSPPSNDR